MNLQKICIIPARGGSKRIPRKNIRNFRGHPVISWSVRAALQSKCFDRIIVSTDDAEIANYSESIGAEIPFVRPSALSNDLADTRSVVKHAINALFDQPSSLIHVCCLYATSPFVLPNDISSSYELFCKSRIGSVIFPATSFPFPIQRAIRIDSEGYSSCVDSASMLRRSQDLEEYFHDAGQFYWATANTWCGKSNLYENGRPLLLPRWRVQDIDTEEDWKSAELMHSLLWPSNSDD